MMLLVLLAACLAESWRAETDMTLREVPASACRQPKELQRAKDYGTVILQQAQ